MSSYLKNNSISTWEQNIGSNAEQQYLTHALFRYFGKLPPVLTGQLIDQYAYKNTKTPIIADFMCGSGTTLVEAQKRNIKSYGVDANDLSLAVTRVKTTRCHKDLLIESENQFTKSFKFEIENEQKGVISDEDDKYDTQIPVFHNIDKWFPKKTQRKLVKIQNWVETFKDKPELYDVLFITWISIIRASSNASASTGRIFHDRDKPEQPVHTLFLKRLKRNIKIISSIPYSHFKPKPNTLLGDARDAQLHSKVDFSFFHPPYFALYKYSSDVLRFELEWAKISRKEILSREVRDGFKTTKPELAYTFCEDIVDVISNGLSQTNDGGVLGMVIGNSTLSQKQLPIIETILELSNKNNISCLDVIERPINHAQASYHKSANENIKSDRDYIMIFERD